MGRGKKIGIVLILVGLCIPILAMLFADGYDSRRHLISNAQDAEVIIWKQTSLKETPIVVKAGSVKLDEQTNRKPDIFDKIEANGKADKIEYLGPLKNSGNVTEAPGPWEKYDPLGLYETLTYVIPYRYILSLGIILTAIGIGLVVCSPKR